MCYPSVAGQGGISEETSRSLNKRGATRCGCCCCCCSIDLSRSRIRLLVHHCRCNAGRALISDYRCDIYVVVVVRALDDALGTRATTSSKRITNCPARLTGTKYVIRGSATGFVQPSSHSLQREITPLPQRPSATEITDGVKRSRAGRVDRSLKG